jgi:hypothetical protein
VGFTLRPATATIPQLDTAVQHIRSKKNILILAPDKLGKSTFLLNLRTALPANLRPVVFSAEHCQSINAYIRKNLRNIFSTFKDIIDNPDELFSLSLIELDKRISALKLGDAAKQSLKLLLFYENDPKAALDDVLRSFHDLPAILAAETKTTAVYLVDDANLLAGIKSDKTSLSVFLDLLKDNKDSIAVLASSTQLKLELRLDRFEELRIDPLSIDAARAFLNANALDLDEPALNTLYNTTQGIPFYLNFFGNILLMTGASKSAAITAAIDNSIHNDLHIYFSERIKQLSPKELPILFCMAEHNVNTPSRISKLLDYSQTNVRRFLSIMEEKGFVTLKERGVFEIHDPVFRRWLESQSRQ